MLAFVNDRFIKEKEASLGIGDLSIQRGYGIFDFFRTINYVPLFLDDYLDRFYNSARLLRFTEVKPREEIKTIISEMIDRNGVAEAGYKMILTGGYSADGYEPGPPNFIIISIPLDMGTKETFDKGIKIILHEYQRDVPYAKTTNYLMAIYLRNKLVEQNADEILYYKDGLVLEFPRSNVFIVTKDQTVVTPAENVLHGITRKKVLEIAGRKYKTEARAVMVNELKNAAEVFLTNTTKRLLPVLQIEGVAVGDGTPGEITTLLNASFLRLEEEYCKAQNVLV